MAVQLTMSIVSTLKALREELPDALLKEIDEIGTMLTDRIAMHTPVGKQIDDETGREVGETGHLKRSWKKLPAKREGEDRYTSGSKNDTEYCSWVNDGTRAHIIEPKAERRARAAAEGRGVALRFWSKGEMMMRARVHHPGARGRFFVQKGAMDTEREWPERAEVRFSVLARKVEERGEQNARREF
jgi:hypothetical protein